jgi:drug/metabolite transporter (DMT)-like permease
VFFLLAQVYAGPALIPGLMASGLIVLALGSAWFLHEPPTFGDWLGIAALIAAAVLLGLSHLSIDLAVFDILEAGFLRRAALFSVVVLVFFLILLALGRRKLTRGRLRGLNHALRSGLLYVLCNFWVGPFTGTVLRLFQGRFSLPLAAMFAFTSAVLVLTSLFGIAELQRAFRVSRASVAVPVQMLPMQVAPAIVYLVVFRLEAPSIGALLLFVLGALLIVVSSFLLGGSQDLGGLRSQAAPPRTPGRHRAG